MQEVTFPVRLFYSKTGRARYISHLDTMRAMTRALRRSGLPFWYTQGFNPHMYLTFPLPLALGVEGLCEIVDLRLTRELDWGDVSNRIGECLPPGFEMKRAGPPVLPATAIAWAEYELELDFPPHEREAVAFALRELFRGSSIVATKKTKKGEQITDIRPHAVLLELSETETGIGCCLRLAAGNTVNVSHRLVLDAMARAARFPDKVTATRTRILDGKLGEFE